MLLKGALGHKQAQRLPMGFISVSLTIEGSEYIFYDHTSVYKSSIMKLCHGSAIALLVLCEGNPSFTGVPLTKGQ